MARTSQKKAKSSPSPPKQRRLRSSNVEGITSPELKRLCMVAGATKVSGLVYEELRGIILMKLREYERTAITIVEGAHRKTISQKDVLYAVELSGQKTYHASGELKKCKITTKKKLESKIKDYQSRHDCVFINRSSMNRLMKEVSEDFGEFRFSEDAKATLHISVEQYIIGVVTKAVNAMLHAHRVILHIQDISLVRKMCQ